MTPAKGQSSSLRKGKDVVSDIPATHDEGEEVVCSKFDSFDEEEPRNPLDSECAPLIDPWYDVHSHFPKVPDNYTPPLLGRVWLALCRHNMEASWAPLASSIPNLVIRQGTSLPVPIHLEFGLGLALGWKE